MSGRSSNNPNKYTMTSTPHKCGSPPGRYISSCDMGGCGTNAFNVDRNGMCPDAHCKIDTRRPFRIHQSYEVDSGSRKLTRITNRLVQGNSTFTWGVCNSGGYLEQMTDALKGDLKMVFQLWGTTNSGMRWLDGMTGCSGDCNKDSATVTFSNIEIRSLSALCPGGSLSACMQLCPSDPTAFKACVQDCEARCEPHVVV